MSGESADVNELVIRGSYLSPKRLGPFLWEQKTSGNCRALQKKVKVGQLQYEARRKGMLFV